MATRGVSATPTCGGVVNVFSAPMSLRDERLGVLVQPDHGGAPAGRTSTRLQSRLSAANERHEQIVPDRPEAVPTITEEIAERLRALGYME